MISELKVVSSNPAHNRFPISKTIAICGQTEVQMDGQRDTHHDLDR